MAQKLWVVGSLMALAPVGCAHDSLSGEPLAVAAASNPHSTGNERTNPIDGASMVYIPGGEFIMGTDPEEMDRTWKSLMWDDDGKRNARGEQPAHRVRVDGFWMYRNDVTVAQYRKFCEATGRSMPAPPAWSWRDEYPIVNVSWEDSKAYCAWAKARLPYEAEWEYAARGGNTGVDGRAHFTFVWGDQYPGARVANLADASFKKSPYYNPNLHLFPNYDDGYVHASPAGAFAPNGFGLHDMAGNVWQWCEDWSDKDYYRSSPAENPHGPATGQSRVLRGGAFDTTPDITRVARRIGSRPDVRHDEKGFRCVVDSDRP